MYQQIKKIDLTFPPNVPQETVNKQKEIYKEFEGTYRTCKFNKDDLVSLLIKWKAGSFSTKDFDVAECEEGTMPLSQPRSSASNEDFQVIAALAYQYRLRPSSLGGGNGSYIGFTHPEVASRGFRVVSITSDEIVIERANLRGIVDMQGRLKISTTK